MTPVSSEPPAAPETPSSRFRPSDLVIQAIAGFFVTVMAPVLVALGMKFYDHLTPAKPDADKPTATAADKPTAEPAPTPGGPTAQESKQPRAKEPALAQAPVDKPAPSPAA